MTQHPLDEFGKLLMERVRDEAIWHWDAILSGHMKGKTAETVRQEVGNLGPEAKEVLARIIPEVVDTTLHYLLWTIDQNEDLSVSFRGGPELRDASDGLTGDLLIWMEMFSKQRSFP